MTRPGRITLVASLVVTVLGCKDVKRWSDESNAPSDPLLGTWRLVGENAHETLAFYSDGTYYWLFGGPKPASSEEFRSKMRANFPSPGRFTRNARVVVLERGEPPETAVSDDSKADLGSTGTTFSYVVSGDILETASERKTHTYVRIK